MGSLLPAITGTMWLYIVWRFVWPMGSRVWVRLGLALLLLLASQVHQITGRYFGSLASPEVPHAVLVVLVWAFAFVLLLSILLLLRDIIGVLVWLPLRQSGRWVLGAPAVRLGLGVLALGLATLGVWQAIRVPDVRQVSVTIPHLPAALDGYEIVQLTDLHASQLLPRSWQASVVARANQLKPDLIVITGDLSDGTVAARADDVQPLARLSAPDGVIAIPGNHEYYSNYSQWIPAYRALGLTLLENSHVLILHGGATLAVVGLTDRQAQRFGLPGPDLHAAMQGVPVDAVVLLLEHRPGSAPENARAGVTLQLSGHTHGGQILGLHYLTQRVNNGFVSGLYAVGNMALYVSNGTGLWNGLAVRLGRSSEITRITLRAGR
ncbi:MAG: metallophosphoesterase [Castellaniella sp.]